MQSHGQNQTGLHPGLAALPGQEGGGMVHGHLHQADGEISTEDGWAGWRD